MCDTFQCRVWPANMAQLLKVIGRQWTIKCLESILGNCAIEHLVRDTRAYLLMGLPMQLLAYNITVSRKIASIAPGLWWTHRCAPARVKCTQAMNCYVYILACLQAPMHQKHVCPMINSLSRASRTLAALHSRNCNLTHMSIHSFSTHEIHLK